MARGSIPHRNDRRSIVNSPEFEPVQYTICLHFICPGLCIRGSWLLQAEVVGFWLSSKNHCDCNEAVWNRIDKLGYKETTSTASILSYKMSTHLHHTAFAFREPEPDYISVTTSTSWSTCLVFYEPTLSETSRSSETVESANTRR